jgi:hypothetical protein
MGPRAGLDMMKRKIPSLRWDLNPVHPIVEPVVIAIPTELSRFFIGWK